MRVQVRLFAAFRSFLPAGSEGATCNLDLPAGATVWDALFQLDVPVDRPEILALLVNGRHGELGQVLQEGDVVAAFPAMAGG